MNTKHTSKSSIAIIVASMIAAGFVGLANAVPDPFACGPQGSSTAPNTHNYDGDTAGILTVVYNQCLDPSSPSNTVTGTDDEWAAGIDGAFYNSADDVVGVNAPANDLVNGVNADAYTTVNPANVGGVNNCFGAPFTAHHGVDRYIDTQDAVEGANIRVFVTADNHDDPGEQAYDAILNANGGVWPAGVDDPRSPCGDNSIDATDLSSTSEPCGFTIPTGPNCAINQWDSGSSLAAVAGLDGNVVTFIGISTGNFSVATSGKSWTTGVESICLCPADDGYTVSGDTTYVCGPWSPGYLHSATVDFKVGSMRALTAEPVWVELNGAGAPTAPPSETQHTGVGPGSHHVWLLHSNVTNCRGFHWQGSFTTDCLIGPSNPITTIVDVYVQN